MATDSYLIQESLELAAEKVDDLSPAVYGRFFELHPEARDLFGSDDGNLIKGSMLNGILYTVMRLAEGQDPEPTCCWAMDHPAYEVSLPMFPAMFRSILAALQECLGDAFSSPMLSAWLRQFESMMAAVEGAYAAWPFAVPNH